MKYDYSVFRIIADGQELWIAKSKKLNGCVAQGYTMKEAIEVLESNEAEWIASAKKHNITVSSNNV